MSKGRLLTASVVVVAVALCATGVLARPQGTQPGASLDTATRAEIIESLLRRLNAWYVFPDLAKKMEQAVRERAARREYEGITSPAAFARKLTEDLQSVSHDRHLRVLYEPQGLPARAGDELRMTREEQEEFRRLGESTNFGFERVERLEGNIGYIDVRRFFPADFSGDTVAAVMNFLHYTDALIIDLRNHHGGEPETVALLCSYFFAEPTHLNDLYFRPEDRTQQFWTLPHLAGARYLDKPIYLLTSSGTFSGAEELAYNLKNLKRATIVGETTGGGAHPAPFVPLTRYVGAQIPIARPINPVTKTDWEGVGVAPDVAVPAERALSTAHLAAAKELLRKGPNPMMRAALSRLVERLQKETGSGQQ